MNQLTDASGQPTKLEVRYYSVLIDIILAQKAYWTFYVYCYGQIFFLVSIFHSIVDIFATVFTVFAYNAVFSYNLFCLSYFGFYIKNVVTEGKS